MERMESQGYESSSANVYLRYETTTRMFVCLATGCASISFHDSADLERHLNQAHTGDSLQRHPNQQFYGGGLQTNTYQLCSRDDLYDNNVHINQQWAQQGQLLDSYSESQNQARKFVCLSIGCTAEPFGRSADLDRHQKQIHAIKDNRDKFYCDYRECQRKDGAFGRKDHFRDHFRDYHKEDIPQQGRTTTRGPYNSPNINIDWWRCSRCLKRVEVASNGYECPECRYLCEADRRKIRNTMLRKETWLDIAK